MHIEEVRYLQTRFLNNKVEEVRKKYNDLEKLRAEFVRKFPLSKIASLSLEDYVVGHGSESFCNWLETKLMGLGKIKGGSTADKKFGVYYGKTSKDATKKYRNAKMWGTTPDEAFRNIKTEIAHLIESGNNNNLRQITENKISPMFKGKILSTYYPEKYLCIFSEQHINHFLDMLPIKFRLSESASLEEKKNILLNFKKLDDVMKEWDNYLFMVFLYSELSPKIAANIPEGLNEYMEESYPSLETVKAEFIDLEFIDSNAWDRNETMLDSYGKEDYEKKNHDNIKLGLRGERIVYHEEFKILERLGKGDLAKKVQIVSLVNDVKGYDILSFNEFGVEKYIEVKSTKSKPTEINFIITENERQKSLKLDNYYIYVVFEAHTQNPKIQIIKSPFNSLGNEIFVEPIRYRVRIGVKK